MSADGQGSIYISYTDFYEWVQKFATFLKGSQYALGPVGYDDEGLVIPYAFGDEVHPKDWSKPPEWLKERK